MSSILDYINKKGYNIFQSIQLLCDMDMYKDMTGIFNELRDIMPDTIHISTEGIEDEKILFILYHINGCSLRLSSDYYWVDFIKNDKILFRWSVKDDRFLVDYNEIWTVFEDKYKMTSQETLLFTKDQMKKILKLMM